MRTYRFTDVMCAAHRTSILDSRMWPERYMPGNPESREYVVCPDCAETGEDLPRGYIQQAKPFLEPYSRAIHEAGHVVLYALVGREAWEMSLTGPPDKPSSNAYCVVDMDKPGEEVLYGLFGGSMAVLRWADLSGLTSDSDAIDAISGGMDDVRIAREIFGDDRELFAATISRVSRLTADFWGHIEKLAEALTAAGELRQPDIEAITGELFPRQSRRHPRIDAAMRLLAR